jgi:threonine/homoserine/homoserine lactone efflux protein
MTFLTFVAATCFLLALPGPTNTLLAASGAEVGMRRSLHLLAAELAGYLVAITLLRVVLGPVVGAMPLASTVLRILVSIYVLCLAARLWRLPSRQSGTRASVQFTQVLATTLLNPKAMVFAFLLLPLESAPNDLAARLAVIAALIVAAGAGWIMLGATLGRGARRFGHPRLVTRTGAAALVAVTGLIWLQSLAGS